MSSRVVITGMGAVCGAGRDPEAMLDAIIGRRSAIGPIRARWASVILCGHSYAPIRATAAASSVTALSSCRNEPWPAWPSAIRLSQAIPFSAVCTR